MKTSITILRCLFLIGGLLILSFGSCDKRPPETNLVSETGKDPIRADRFLFQSNQKIKTRIKIKDQQGNLLSLDEYRRKMKQGNPTLNVCGSGNELDYVELYYRGFNIDNLGPCAGGFSGSVNVSWDLTLPSDISPIRTDVNSKTMVKLTPYGWQSSPSGTGARDLSYSNVTLISSFNSGGVNYQQWRINTSYTPTNQADYCFNTQIESRFQIATNCPDFTIVSSDDIVGAPIQEYYDVASKKILPLSLVYNATPNGSTQTKIEVNWSIALCTPPACKGTGYYTYSDYIEFQYKKPNASWSLPVVRTQLLSFIVSTGTQRGLITYRHRGKINTNNDFSECKFGTVNIP